MSKAPRQIMAVDCCEHAVAALRKVPLSRVTSVWAKDKGQVTAPSQSIDLIVVGIARYPTRRLLISQLRRGYPNAPLLILRREDPCWARECPVRGEFVLSDQRYNDDYELVRSLRAILPLKACAHTVKVENYETVREVTRIIYENYSNPALDLKSVARTVPISPPQLSRILNQEVGVSFRHLLRETRIEEAMRMLASKRFSVEEVATRVGFSDSHYFSRSFKEITGLSASGYQSRDVIFG